MEFSPFLFLFVRAKGMNFELFGFRVLALNRSPEIFVFKDVVQLMYLNQCAKRIKGFSQEKSYRM